MSLKDITNDPLTPEEQNLFKEANKFIQEEYTIKKEYLKKLKIENSNMKKIFQIEVKEYQKENKLATEKENEIELLFSLIAKYEKKQILSLNNFLNNKCYAHLLEIAENPKRAKLLKTYFDLILYENNQKTRSIIEFLKIIKNETELKSLLLYIKIAISSIIKNTPKKYQEIKKKFNSFKTEIEEVDNGYPFDFLCEYMGEVLDIIDLEEEIQKKEKTLDKLTEKKNAKFIELKSVESQIKKSNKALKLINNYIKGIMSLFNRIKEMSLSNNAHTNFLIRTLINDIETYKKIDIEYNKGTNEIDAMTSLTFGTNYTFSEDSSIKSSVIESKFSKISLSNKSAVNFNQNLIMPSNISESLCTNINKINTSTTNNINFIKNNINENGTNIKNNLSTKTNSSKLNNYILDNKKIKKSQKSFVFSSFNFRDKIIHHSPQGILGYSKKNSLSISTKFTNKNNHKSIIQGENYIHSSFNSICNSKENEKESNDKSANEGKNFKNLNKSVEDRVNISISSCAQQIFNDVEQSLNIKSKNFIEDNSKPEVLYNQRYDNGFNNSQHISKKKNKIKQKDPDESLDLENYNEYDLSEKNDFMDGDFKDSVCDEMVSQNFDTSNCLLKSNEYICPSGMKKNLLFTKGIYNRKNIGVRKSDFTKLKIERSVEESSCCISCT